jgi:hypothetical protein
MTNFSQHKKLGDSPLYETFAGSTYKEEFNQIKFKELLCYLKLI